MENGERPRAPPNPIFRIPSACPPTAAPARESFTLRTVGQVQHAQHAMELANAAIDYLAAFLLPPAKEEAIVIVGSGYLAQFLLEHLHDTVAASRNRPNIALHYTYRLAPLDLPFAATAHRVDVTDRDSIAAMLASVQPRVVVNCAAMSSLAACAEDEGGATATNAPAELFQALSELERPPLLVQLSTDQVYDGTAAPYEDVDPGLLGPMNAYGRSKKACEELLRASPLRAIVLRSSNILGPEAPFTGTGKFLQWLEGALEKACAGGTVDADSVTLFCDEYRNFIWVGDICHFVAAIAVNELSGSFPDGSALLPGPSADDSTRWFNMGGPEKLSRADVGLRVCAAFGHDPKAIAHVERYGETPHPSAAGNPQDISMLSDKIVAASAVPRTSVGAALVQLARGAASNGQAAPGPPDGAPEPPDAAPAAEAEA